MQGFMPQPQFVKGPKPPPAAPYQPPFVKGPKPHSGVPHQTHFVRGPKVPPAVPFQPPPQAVGGFSPNIPIAKPIVTKTEWGRGFQPKPSASVKHPIPHEAEQPPVVKGFTPRQRIPRHQAKIAEDDQQPANIKGFSPKKRNPRIEEAVDDVITNPVKVEARGMRFKPKAEEQEDEYESDSSASAKPTPKPKPKISVSSSGGVGMCTAEEAQEREQGNLLSVFEMEPEERGKAKLDWAVKSYTRSSGDVDQGDNLRSEAQLEKTLMYLIDNILDVDQDDNPNNYQLPYDKDYHDFLDIHLFLSDRYRAICKDYNIMKPMTSNQYLTTLRLIARFHVIASSQGLEFAGFDAKPNSDRLQDVLSTLCSLYQYRKSIGMDCPGEDETLHYSMLLHLPRPLEFYRLLNIATEIDFNDHFAVQCFIAFQTQDFVSFFKHFKKADYLSACLLQQHFDGIRLAALRTLIKSYPSLELGAVMRLLALEDQDFAFEYLTFRGIVFNQDKTCIVSFKESELIEDKYKQLMPELQVEIKKEGKFRRELIKGGFILPTLVSTPPPPSNLPPPSKPVKVPKTEPVVVSQPGEIKQAVKVIPKVPRDQPSLPKVEPAILPVDQIVKPPSPPIPSPSRIELELPKPPLARSKTESPKSLPKSNTFTFPSETTDLLKLCGDDSSRKLFKSAVKQYRKQIKMKTGQKLNTETYPS